jgi:hypothetical protein
MPRHALYWIFQIAGWGILFLLNVPYMVSSGLSLPLVKIVETMALCSLTGLLLTHFWHLELRRKRFVDMPFSASYKHYLAGAAGMACALTLTSGFWYRLFLFPDSFSRLNWVPAALIFWGVIVIIWTAIYVTAGSLRRSSKLEKQRLTADVLAKEARLEGLRKQLNPHFLFNSLNSIRALIFEDAQKASEMVDRLASLLRYSLQSGSNEMVTLAEELVMTNEYLSIEKIRFEERLNVEMSISEDSRQALLPRMMLQTLVENAVKHGIERSVGGGTVTDAAFMQDGSLRLMVRNPGLLQADSKSTQVGLKNAEQRLALLVGSGASLSIRQADANVEAMVAVPQ